jgi:hypothetical protein
MNTTGHQQPAASQTSGRAHGFFRKAACVFLGCPVPPHKPSLDQQAQALLARRNYTTVLPTLKELAGSFDYNNNKIMKKIGGYKTVGFFLLFAIPVVSTLIAFVVNITPNNGSDSTIKWLEGSVPLLSLCLALMTVLNSVVKPAVRFESCCRIGIDLFHWRCAFLEGMETLNPLDDKTLVEFLARERKKFKEIQEADIGLALPDQT